MKGARTVLGRTTVVPAREQSRSAWGHIQGDGRGNCWRTVRLRRRTIGTPASRSFSESGLTSNGVAADGVDGIQWRLDMSSGACYAEFGLRPRRQLSTGACGGSPATCPPCASLGRVFAPCLFAGSEASVGLPAGSMVATEPEAMRVSARPVRRELRRIARFDGSSWGRVATNYLTFCARSAQQIQLGTPPSCAACPAWPNHQTARRVRETQCDCVASVWSERRVAQPAELPSRVDFGRHLAASCVTVRRADSFKDEAGAWCVHCMPQLALETNGQAGAHLSFTVLVCTGHRPGSIVQRALPAEAEAAANGMQRLLCLGPPGRDGGPMSSPARRGAVPPSSGELSTLGEAAQPGCSLCESGRFSFELSNH